MRYTTDPLLTRRIRYLMNNSNSMKSNCHLTTRNSNYYCLIALSLS